jgi:hypothetical protein
MSARLRPPGAPTRASGARPLGSGLRLRRDLSLRADAMRRFSAAAGPALEAAPEAASGPAVPTALTAMACGLYEAGVVPVATIAALCGVSERTLYRHARKGGWRFRYRRAAARAPAPPSAPRPARTPRGAGGRFVAKAQAGAPHRSGLKALDPAGEAQALSACEQARAFADAALARAIARQDADAKVRGLWVLVRAHAAVQGIRKRRTRKPRKPEKPPKPRATLYDTADGRSPDELRAELARRIAGLIADRQPARVDRDAGPAPFSPVNGGGDAPARPPASPLPNLPSAAERRAEIIVERLRSLRRRPY